MDDTSTDGNPTGGWYDWDGGGMLVPLLILSGCAVTCLGGIISFCILSCHVRIKYGKDGKFHNAIYNKIYS